MNARGSDSMSASKDVTDGVAVYEISSNSAQE